LFQGGRLVIVDPLRTEHGTLNAEEVEGELRLLGFHIVRRQEHFIDQPGAGPWWQIVVKRNF
jgi:hypothetical protein